MEENYKGHNIRAHGTKTFVDESWRPQVTILWQEEGFSKLQPFTLEQGFSTAEQAARLGVIFARHWIDNGKPNPAAMQLW
jgi:hypothetical protein